MIKIRKFKKTDIYQIADLIKKVFKEFNTKGQTKKAIKAYLAYYDTKNNLKGTTKNFLKSKIFFVATQKNKIIGVVRGNKERITNLYIDGHYHKRGIGRKLMHIFEKSAKKTGSSQIKIRSSLFAVPFYQKIGYKKTTGIRKMQDEIRIQSMQKYLK